MEKPNVKEGDIIRIGNATVPPKGMVVEVYGDETKKDDLFGDIAVVYHQNGLKGIKDDVIWDGQYWQFKNKGPSGSYIDIDLYPEVKIKKHKR